MAWKIHEVNASKGFEGNNQAGALDTSGTSIVPYGNMRAATIHASMHIGLRMKMMLTSHFCLIFAYLATIISV